MMMNKFAPIKSKKCAVVHARNTCRRMQLRKLEPSEDYGKCINTQVTYHVYKIYIIIEDCKSNYLI